MTSSPTGRMKNRPCALKKSVVGKTNDEVSSHLAQAICKNVVKVQTLDGKVLSDKPGDLLN